MKSRFRVSQLFTQSRQIKLILFAGAAVVGMMSEANLPEAHANANLIVSAPLIERLPQLSPPQPEEEEIKIIEDIPLIQIGDQVINLEFEPEELTESEFQRRQRPFGYTPSGEPIYSTSWNECSGIVRGNYEGARCTTARGMASEFLVFMQRQLVGCVNQGLRSIGLPNTDRISLIHRGVMADDNHGRASLHAVGRAIDIARITAYPKGLDAVTMDYLRAVQSPSSRERKFYVKLRQCFGEIHRSRGCPRRRSGQPLGTIAWEDRDHRRHIHVSMPFCPNTRGFNLTDDEVKPFPTPTWDI
ncbi:MAG TPA: hypothetical protein PLZ57_06145 [Pseudobdellovibrionaceae bacterium]|nr:hypothetical protein [Pseudobdellovibrionaceae bacterium]